MPVYVKMQKILHALTTPKTTRQVENKLKIKKLKLKPLLEKGLLKILNPKARKGRLYILSEKAREMIGTQSSNLSQNLNFDLIGKIIASPRQKLSVLKTIDTVKKTSENIRLRASKLNPHLTRISTKGILKKLLRKNLVESEMSKGRRYYWINEKGKKILTDIESMSL